MIHEVCVVLCSLTQVVVQEYNCPRFIKTIYWITTAGTFCPSLHCVLVTSFLIVYGPNLAIRGPIGSMKRAIDMMVEEQTEVFVSFILTLAIFSELLLLCFTGLCRVVCLRTIVCVLAR
jgi:hypothetical protein